MIKPERPLEEFHHVYNKISAISYIINGYSVVQASVLKILCNPRETTQGEPDVSQ